LKGKTKPNITLEDSGRFRVNMKISIFKKLGESKKRTGPKARRLQAESRYPQAKKPTAQTAHLVFLQTRKPTLKKPKELFTANVQKIEKCRQKKKY
tara:strand:+ start:689 stop:976 length:288 start_codon:yes stop_codon:yes gene_type:complete